MLDDFGLLRSRNRSYLGGRMRGVRPAAVNSTYASKQHLCIACFVDGNWRQRSVALPVCTAVPPDPSSWLPAPPCSPPPQRPTASALPASTGPATQHPLLARPAAAGSSSAAAASSATAVSGSRLEAIYRAALAQVGVDGRASGGGTALHTQAHLCEKCSTVQVCMVCMMRPS